MDHHIHHHCIIAHIHACTLTYFLGQRDDMMMMFRPRLAVSLPLYRLKQCFSTGQRVDNRQLQLLANQFPPVLHAFGYGSGVFSQTDNTGGMVDIVLVVDDAVDWHAQNLVLHSHHYAPLARMCGSSMIAKIQRIPPGVYFHAGVEIKESNSLVKYGVVEANMIKDDLRDWKYLYLAGRLHKPTVCIVENEEIMELQNQVNLPAALATSLLLLSSNNNTTTNVQTYSLSKIYQQIASISYAGDLRVSVGAEDPLKIQKLVHSDGQFERWNDLYKDSLDMLTSSGIVSLFDDDYIECNLNESSRDELWKRVPLQVRRKGNVLELRQSLASIVAPAARNQTIKGVVTAGPVKSALYALNKLKKGILKSK